MNVPIREDFTAISIAEQPECCAAFSTASCAIWYMADAIFFSTFREGSTFNRRVPVKWLRMRPARRSSAVRRPVRS